MKKLLKTILILFVSISLVSCSKTENPKAPKKVEKSGKLFPENKDKLVFDKRRVGTLNKVNCDIFKNLVKENGNDKNIFLSPMSIQQSIYMISLATDDREDLSGLTSIISGHILNLKLKNSSLSNLITLNLENIKGETKEINYDNIRTVKNSKEASEYYQDFQYSILKEVLDDKELDNTSIAGFFSTVHFEAKWDQAFSKEKTEKRDFTKLDGTKIQVDTMLNTFKNVKGISDNNIDMFAIKANGSNIYFIRKKNNDMLGTGDLLFYILGLKESTETYDVNFYLPKIDIKSSVDCKSSYKKFVSEKLFNSFKLEKLLGDAEIKITEAKQNSILKIDENGINVKDAEKASKESNGVAKNGELTVKMDGPFYIVIEDIEENTNTEMITFSSYIADPSSNK